MADLRVKCALQRQGHEKIYGAVAPYSSAYQSRRKSHTVRQVFPWGGRGGIKLSSGAALIDQAFDRALVPQRRMKLTGALTRRSRRQRNHEKLRGQIRN